MQGWYTVLGAQAATCGHHIEAVGAVTLHMQVGLGVPVLHYHDESRPAMSQVIAGHALSTLGTGTGWVGQGWWLPTLCPPPCTHGWEMSTVPPKSPRRHRSTLLYIKVQKAWGMVESL